MILDYRDDLDGRAAPNPALALLLLAGAAVGAAAAWLMKTPAGQRLREEAAVRLAQGREELVSGVEGEASGDGPVKERR